MKKHDHSGAGKRYQARSTERVNSSPPGGRQPTSSPQGMARLAAQNPAGLGRHAGPSAMAQAATAAHRGFTARKVTTTGPGSSNGARSSTLDQVLATGKLGLRDGN